MIGTSRRKPVARGLLTRLAAVAAILAGLVLLLGPQCADGMTFMGHVAQDPSPAVGVSAMRPMHGDMAPDAADQAAPPSGSHGTGGFLATCLVLIMAVLAAVAGLRSHHQLFTVAMFPTGRIAVRLRSVVPRAPTLEELCLLRT